MRSVIPSLNLNSDNLRKKTTENMKYDVRNLKNQNQIVQEQSASVEPLSNTTAT